MARILALSSYVAHGHVGLSALVPALQTLGHEVVAIPSVVLSNHYGYEEVGGWPSDRDTVVGAVGSIMMAVDENGWLSDIDALVTGYLPCLELIEKVPLIVDRLGRDSPDLVYLCDPVIGDDPHGLYVPEERAAAIRDLLVPIADVITPNRFELSWLTGMPILQPEDVEDAVVELGDGLTSVTTSVPAGAGLIGNVLVTDTLAGLATTPQRERVPHGTGDLFTGLLIGHLLGGHTEAEATARATAGVRLVIEESVGAEELRLATVLRDCGEAQQPFVAFADIGE